MQVDAAEAELAGEANDSPGYETLGRLFAIGYVRGLVDAIDGTTS